MAADVTLARNVSLEIDTDGLGSWVTVEGVTQLQHQPQTTRADAQSFSAAGYSRQIITSRGDTFTGNYLIWEDEGDGSRDPGQESLEGFGFLSGQAGVANFRVTRAGGGTITFTADVETNLIGGGVQDLSTASFTLNSQSPPVFA